MKHLVKTIVVVAAVLLAAGCTKETLPTPQPADQTRHVGYVKCGEPGSATVTGEEAWHALLDSLLTSAEGGCAVTFWDADLTAAQPTKETVTYSTASRDSAFAWGERMYDQGYTVSVVYDPLTGQYNCSAARTTHIISNEVGFTTCGGVSHRTVNNYGEWILLLDWLFDAHEQYGCKIRYWDYNYHGDNSHLPKDSVFFTAHNRSNAYTWSQTMFDSGYVVSVQYNATNGSYTLGAIPLTTATTGYVAIPLVDYLPGTWIMDVTSYYILESSGFKQHPFFFSNDLNDADSLIVGVDTLYMSKRSSGWGEHYHEYTIVDDVNITIDGYTWPCHIIQLNTDSMLFMGYYGMPLVYEENPADYGYLFKRATN